MWGRDEALRFIKIVIFPMAIFFLSIAPAGVAAQTLPEGVMRILEAEAERGVGDLEELVNYCEHLMENRIDVNSATEGELAAFPLLSPFQVASIVEYRDQYGAILSAGELAQVDGFNDRKVEVLLPFITFGSGASIRPSAGERGEHKLILRGGDKFDQREPFNWYGKYQFRVEDKLQVGSTLSRKGVSAHLKVGNVPLGNGWDIRSAVVGDYTVRLGQGLLLWNSFSLSGTGAPASLLKLGNGVVQYTASSPEEAFRGVGATLLYGDRWDCSIFYSEQEDRVTGGSIGFNGNGWRLGINGVAWQNEAWAGGISADAVWSLGRYRFFGEAAFDSDGDEAALIGAILPLGATFECSAMVRWYSPDYSAQYAGAFSSISSCKDQLGGVVNILWIPQRKLLFRGYVDVVYYPAPRWGVKVPSFEVESSCEGEWTKGESKLMLRWRYRFYGYEGRHQQGIRLHYSYHPASGFYMAARAEVVWNNLATSSPLEPGVALYAECGYTPLRKKWEVAVRGTLYHIDKWENRIYFYERDLPQSFSVPALYRRGWDLYGYIKYAPLSRVGLYLKVSTKMLKGQINLTF